MTINDYIKSTRFQISEIDATDEKQLRYLFSVVSNRVLNKDVELELCSTANMQSCLVSLEKEYLVFDVVSLFFIKELFSIVSSKSWLMLDFQYNYIRELSSFQHGDIYNNYKYNEQFKIIPAYMPSSYIEFMEDSNSSNQINFVILFVFLHELMHKYINAGKKEAAINYLVDDAVERIIKTETRYTEWGHSGKLQISDQLINEMYCDANAMMCLLELDHILPHEYIINSCFSAIIFSWAVNHANVQYYNDRLKFATEKSTAAYARVGVLNWILDTITSDSEFAELLANRGLNKYKTLKNHDKTFTKELYTFIQKWNGFFFADVMHGAMFFADEMDSIKSHWESRKRKESSMTYKIFGR